MSKQKQHQYAHDMIYSFLRFDFFKKNYTYIMICLEKEVIHHDLGFLEGSLPFIYFLLYIRAMSTLNNYH
jgi:hypothetical protein